jgi:penicillin-binding protein 2
MMILALMFIILERQALRVEGIDIAGKTGTAENFAKIDGKKSSAKGSLDFVAFAKDNPKIAIAFWSKMEV